MDATVITNGSIKNVNLVSSEEKKRENEFTESELDVRAIYKSNSQDDKRKAG
jgi:hypothetical protein